MSKHDDMLAAISAYVAEVTDGGIVTDWALVTASTEMEDIGSMRATYRLDCPENQPEHVTLGLIEYSRQTYLSGDGDE
jgi:hypothetical protein